MANDLTTRRVDLQAMISSRDCVALRRISLGTLLQPGEKPIKYLSGGLTLTDEKRAEIERKIHELRPVAFAENTVENRKAWLGLISSMLLAYPISGGSEQAGRARAEAYLFALDDVPPWIVSDVIRLWHRGECGDRYNYRFAPAPAELREICLWKLMGARSVLEHLEALLIAPTLEQAMRGEMQPVEQPKLRAV